MMAAAARFPFTSQWFRQAGRAGLAALASGATALAVLRLSAEMLPFRLGSLGEPATVMAVGLVAAGAGAILVLALRRRLGTPDLVVPLTLILAAAAPGEPAIRVALVLAVAAVVLASFRATRRAGPLTIIPVASLIVYLATAAPGLLLGDTGVFQVSAAALEIPHPAGYPLLMLVGHWLGLVFSDSPAFAITLISCFGGAIAGGLVYLWLLWDDVPPPLAAGLALVPAFVGSVWAQAIVGEAYPLHLAFAILAVAPAFAALGGREGPLLPLAALGIGLGLAHHRVIVLVAPAVGLAFLLAWLTKQHRPSARDLGIAIPALLLPLATYAYLPWTADWQMNFGEFRAIVLADRFSGFLNPTEPFDNLAAWPLLWNNLTAIVPLPLLLASGLGSAVLLIRRPLGLVVLAVLAVPHLYFAMAYRVPDVSVYLLMLVPASVYAASQLWFAAEEAIRRCIASAGREWAVTVGAVGALATVWVLMAGNYAQVDLSNETAAQSAAEAAPIDALPSGAVVISDVGRYSPLLYATRVLHDRSDVEVLLPEDEELQRGIVQREIGRQRFAYLARFLPRIEREFTLRALGTLVAVMPPFAEPAPAGAALGVFEPGVALLGAGVAGPVEADGLLQVDVTWQALGKIEPQYWPRLVAVDSFGNRSVLAEGKDPVNGLYATRFWRVGEAIKDAYSLPLDLRLPPGEFALVIELAIPFSPNVAPLRNSESTSLRIGTFGVTPAAFGNPLARRLDPIWDSKLGIESISVAGETNSLMVRWEAAPGDHPDRVIEVGIGFRDGEPSIVTRTPVAANSGGRFGTMYQIPAALRGAEMLAVSIRVHEGEAFLDAKCGWPAQACTGTLLVTAPAAAPARGVANLGDIALLLEARVDPVVVRGSPVTIDLLWESIASTPNDYTVFVQLLDGAGVIAGQIDRPPGDGRRLTSGWRPGETISDRYSIPVGDDLPTGTYQVIVGLYLPSTFQRLPILDQSGVAVSDFVGLGLVTVR